MEGRESHSFVHLNMNWENHFLWDPPFFFFFSSQIRRTWEKKELHIRPTWRFTFPFFFLLSFLFSSLPSYSTKHKVKENFIKLGCLGLFTLIQKLTSSNKPIKPNFCLESLHGLEAPLYTFKLDPPQAHLRSP